MNSISFLGTGSGIPSSDRVFSSSVLFISDRHLLIDAGEPCVHLLCERGNLIHEIDAVLITHGHVDHIGGLPALLQGAMLLKRKKALSVHLPEEMILPIRAWIRSLYLHEAAFGFPISWSAWQPGKSILIADEISVAAHPNDHLKTCYYALPGADPSLPCNSYSLEIFTEYFRAVFSGDLSSPASLQYLLTKPTNVLICELSHFTVEQLADALRKSMVDSLCLVHLSENYSSNRTALQAYLIKNLPMLKDVMIPEDGEVIDF